MNESPNLCNCGCGRIVRHPHARYIKGHAQNPGASSVNDLMDAECAFCHASIKVHRWRIQRFGADNVFCSREHSRSFRAEASSIVFTCEVCGKQRKMKSSRKTGDHVFCSHRCNALFYHPQDRIRVKCEGCGVEYETFPSKSKTNHHFYCSRGCRAKCIRGTNNPAYRSGRGRRGEYGHNWKSQRRAAVLRDNGRCRACDSIPKKTRYLHVHHIRPIYLFNGDWEAANVLPNLVTLCSTCHKKIEAGKAHLPRRTA